MKTIVYTTLGLIAVLPVVSIACFWDEAGLRGYGMMGYGGGVGFFMTAGGIVWLVVGILAGVWLWQNINKK